MIIDKRVITKFDLNKILVERKLVPYSLRTAMDLNMDMQLKWYESEIANRDSKTRYFIFMLGGIDIGYGGVEHIEWENRLGEMSLLIYENHRQKGLGGPVVREILKYAFHTINLKNLWFECYLCNKGGIVFWKKIIDKYDANHTALPNRKFYDGEYYDSYYGSISNKNFYDVELKNTESKILTMEVL